MSAARIMDEKERLLQEIAKYEKLVAMHQTNKPNSLSDHSTKSRLLKKPYKLVNHKNTQDDGCSANKPFKRVNMYAGSRLQMPSPQKLSLKNGKYDSANKKPETSLKNRNVDERNPYSWTKSKATSSADDTARIPSNTIVTSPHIHAHSLSKSSISNSTSVSEVHANASSSVKSPSHQTGARNQQERAHNSVTSQMTVSKQLTAQYEATTCRSSKLLGSVLPQSASSSTITNKASLASSLTNISETYKQLISSVQKSLDNPSPSKSSHHTQRNSPTRQSNSSSKYKVTVHKSSTRVLNKYVPKMKKPVLKTSTKIVNKYVIPPNVKRRQQYVATAKDSYYKQHHYKNNMFAKRSMSRKYTGAQSAMAIQRQDPKEIIDINGQLYKRVNRSFTGTHESTAKSNHFHSHKNMAKRGDQEVKVVRIQGVPFTLSHNGQRLKRLSKAQTTPQNLQNATMSSPTNPCTPNKLRLGKTVFIRKSQAEYIKDSSVSAQKLAVKKVSKSIDVMRKRDSKVTEEKKQYCLFYNRFGRCSKGAQCKFIHDASKIAVCTRFLRGSCSVSNCPFSHEVSEHKMPTCRFFLESYCNKATCPYLHVNVGKAAEVCSHFQRGFCASGRNCSKMHVFACKEYGQTGVCTKGKACKYTHVDTGKYRKKSGADKAVEEKVNNSDLSGSKAGTSNTTRSGDKSKSRTVNRCPSFLSLPVSDDEDAAEDDDDLDVSSQLCVFSSVTNVEKEKG